MENKALMKNTRFLLFIPVFFFVSCSEKKAGEAHPKIPEQAIEKFSVTETREGKPNWELESASAQVIEAKKIALLKAPKIKFYQKGEHISTLTANNGRINTENYDIWGEDSCVLTTVKGERLETSNLHYRSDIQKIVTADKVKLIRPNEIIYGVGMEATPDLESIIIKKQRVEVKGK